MSGLLYNIYINELPLLFNLSNDQKLNNNKWQGPALGARSCHLRVTPAAKSFSTFITVRLVVCLKIHAGCKFDSHTRYNHVTAARN